MKYRDSSRSSCSVLQKQAKMPHQKLRLPPTNEQQLDGRSLHAYPPRAAMAAANRMCRTHLDRAIYFLLRNTCRSPTATSSRRRRVGCRVDLRPVWIHFFFFFFPAVSRTRGDLVYSKSDWKLARSFPTRRRHLIAYRLYKPQHEVSRIHRNTCMLTKERFQAGKP